MESLRQVKKLPLIIKTKGVAIVFWECTKDYFCTFNFLWTHREYPLFFTEYFFWWKTFLVEQVIRWNYCVGEQKSCVYKKVFFWEKKFLNKNKKNSKKLNVWKKSFCKQHFWREKFFYDLLFCLLKFFVKSFF